MSKITEKKKRDIEKINGWNFIDELPMTVPVPLSDEEKLELGADLTAGMQTIDVLEEEKKGFNDRIKGQIADEKKTVRKLARSLRRGTKDVEKVFPVFFDPAKDLRNYFDPETGEVVGTEPGQSTDRQMKMA